MPESGKADRTLGWIRAHPRLASAGALLIIIGIFAGIALNEARTAEKYGAGYNLMKGVALVVGALFIVWRARRETRP